MTLGIPQPDTAAAVQDASTPDGMRRAIFKASYDSSLIRNCMVSADYSGMSAEDRYTMLAYHALLALETYYQQLSCMMLLDPDPPMLRVSKP